MINKYQRLANHLASLSTSPWTATFAEVEAIMGEALPFSAREHRPWWANSGTHSHATAWMRAGWKTAQVDLAAETVVFQRSVAARTTTKESNTTEDRPRRRRRRKSSPARRTKRRERLRELARPFAEPAEDAGPDDALEAVAALLEHADPAEQRVIEILSRVALVAQTRRVADSLEILEDLLEEYATSGQ